jgi:hypothetical protein
MPDRSGKRFIEEGCDRKNDAAICLFVKAFQKLTHLGEPRKTFRFGTGFDNHKITPNRANIDYAPVTRQWLFLEIFAEANSSNV